MRIADRMVFDQVNNTLQKNRSEMADLQNQAATLKRVTKPSDDPLAATRVLGFRTETNVNNQFLKTAAQAKALLDYSDQSLFELTDVLMRAKELVLGQVNDAGGNGETRRLVASEIEQLFQQAVQIGNRKLGDRFLFGGYKTTQSPFDFKGNYNGDDGEIRMPVNKDAFIAVNIPGSKIFLGKAKLDHEIGDETLVVPKDVKDLEKVSEHEKQKVNPEKGADPALRGPASVSAPSGPAADTGGYGMTAAKVRGTNIFRLLQDIETAMQTNDKSALQDSVDDLDEALSQVIMSRAELGARVNTVDANIDSIQKLNVDAKGVASQLEDADQFEVISDITRTEGTLKATLQTSGKLIQPSLLDFLR